MEKGDQAIRFLMSQADQGVTVSLCVEVSFEALASALQVEEGIGRFLPAPVELTGAIRRAIQGEALGLLHEANERLQLRLARVALEISESERPSA